MRIIRGKLKGRVLTPPDKRSNVRPTSDRIKETLFNILGSLDAVEGKSVLDLFSGSGALGIEALSRGAEKAIFVDTDRQSAALVTANLASLGLDCQVFNVDFRFAVRKLGKSNQKFDLIIVDPPYNFGLVGEALALLDKYNILAPQGIIAVEHSSTEELPRIEGYNVDSRPCGSTTLSFVTRNHKGDRIPS